MLKNKKLSKSFFIAFFLATSFALTMIPVFAQVGASIIIYPPDISAFPGVSLYVDVYDSQGRFIPGLNLDSFTIIEDGYEMPVNEVQQLEPGLHSIIAINLGATLSNRDNTSVPTRFETVVFDLANWLNEITSDGTNQYSLTSNEGILIEKLQEKGAFTLQLQNYKPNLFNFEPNLVSLSNALDIASKPNLVPQSKQSILYITPLPLDTDIQQITEIKTRAMEYRVPVNVWLVAPDTAANAPAAIALNDLALSTGGQYLLYTEESPSPNPEDFLGALRRIYQLRYTSDVNQSGAHTVRIKADYNNQEVTSAETPFSIDLTIPSAIFIDLPATINRTYSNTTGTRALQPAFVTLQAEVIFPDGYSRQLRATRLYVDGEMVAENTSEPFTFFPWKLEGYAFSGEHLVSVEVEDILGFRSISEPRPVFISVESLYPEWVTGFLRFFNAGGWILFAVLGLAGAVFTATRLPRRLQQRTQNQSAPELSTGIDPLLQSIPGLEVDTRTNNQDRYRQSITTAPEDFEAHPHLRQIGDQPFGVKKDLLISEEVTIIGSDAEQAAFVLDHPSVSPVHTRISRTQSGNVAVADMRSSTGTWVNYTPISTAGTVLKDGDRVKIGAFTFRYHLGLK